MNDPAARWPVVLAVGPYALLALLAAVTVVIYRSEGVSPALELVLCALMAAWMLGVFTLRPAWRGRAAVMAGFLAVLLLLMAALVVRAPWFGFFTPAAYVYAFRLLRWPWQPAGVAAVAVVAGTAQAYSVDKSTAIGLLTYAAVVAANAIPMCAFAWFARRAARRNEEREQALRAAREANRRLAASLAENAALHEQLLAQARDAGVQEERQRMAREIHDTLAQGLTGIISQLRAAEHAADTAPSRRGHADGAPEGRHGDVGDDPEGGHGDVGSDPEGRRGHATDESEGRRGHVDGDPEGRRGRAAGEPAGRRGHVAADPEGWRRHVAAAAKLARESLAEARRSVHALRPEPLRSARLSEALEGVAERWSALHEIPVQVTTTGTARPIRPEAEAALLRIAQEALANVAKHARASRVGVTLSYLDHEAALDIRDDGGGFDPSQLGAAAPLTDRSSLDPARVATHAAAPHADHGGLDPARISTHAAAPHAEHGPHANYGPHAEHGLHGEHGPHAEHCPFAEYGGFAERGGGFGLIAMRERIESLSGTLQIESEPGNGTGISARVPLSRAEVCA
ncbi:histidine kinase [Nonomuraea rubra]|uniref:Signal transduction histidine kinase n=1 Tax=Nonomuraea rubra TaxID=46180 RepID=A0A7X0NUQ8_9ACTN|nr:histidine kinase [Nonomuraea rubra]MBB6549987.1 signal transduction histidine kinase [Nonomuraea rubra]